jgi:Nucleoside 2-deoxyribosyltransferase
MGASSGLAADGDGKRITVVRCAPARSARTGSPTDRLQHDRASEAQSAQSGRPRSSFAPASRLQEVRQSAAAPSGGPRAVHRGLGRLARSIPEVEARDVYLAAPLFNAAELRFNEGLTRDIEALGLTVFAPQRDGLEFAKLDGEAPMTRARRIFDLDRSMVLAAQIVVAVLDGRVPDEGVCVEVGLARAATGDSGKTIVGLKTDLRSWMGRGGDVNPMVWGALDELLTSTADLVKFLRKLSKRTAR